MPNSTNVFRYACAPDLPIVIRELEGTDVLPTTVIGFPHGTCTTETKVFETKDAILKGAVEVDMVMNIGRFLSGEYDYVLDEIKQVAKAAHDGGAKLKVIFENYYLTDEQIIKASELAKAGGADFSRRLPATRAAAQRSTTLRSW